MHVRLFARPRLLATAMAITVLLLLLLPVAASAQGGGFYQQRNLVSDLPNFAQFRDKSLVNPWGLSHSPNGPWQVSDNGTGLSTQYTSVGKQVPPVVTIPTPAGVTTAAPTGNVFNSTIDFVISKNGKSFASQFILVPSSTNSETEMAMRLRLTACGE
jgi:predicted PurR-regulated permease PerM